MENIYDWGLFGMYMSLDGFNWVYSFQEVNSAKVLGAVRFKDLLSPAFRKSSHAKGCIAIRGIYGGVAPSHRPWVSIPPERQVSLSLSSVTQPKKHRIQNGPLDDWW